MSQNGIVATIDWGDRLPRQRLAHHPESRSPWHAVTAALAHGSLMHLLGNLFGFYVFAATVEAILGPLRFMLSMLLIAIGAALAMTLFRRPVSEARQVALAT